MNIDELKQDSRLQQLDGYLLKCLEQEKDLRVVLSLAKDKLYAFPFDKVPLHWVVLHTVCSILLVLNDDEPIETLDVAVMVAGPTINPMQRHFIDSLYSRHQPEIPKEDFKLVEEDHCSDQKFSGGQPPDPPGSASQGDDEEERLPSSYLGITTTDGKRRKLSNGLRSHAHFERPFNLNEKSVAKRSEKNERLEGENSDGDSAKRGHNEIIASSDKLSPNLQAENFASERLKPIGEKYLEKASGSELPRNGTTLFSPSSSGKRRTPPTVITECPDSGIDLLLTFQRNFDTGPQPMVFRALVSDWPACNLWNSSRYLLKRTRGGQSLVPVELGSSYTAEGWSQRVMPFKRYLYDYILSSATETGYLAQYNLFNQYPELKEDFVVPDICCLGDSDDPPIMNAWLGPKNTVSPLHTDPHHNVFCQVVGYKHIRLYSPSQTQDMYPRGVENGIDMSNTSQVNLESNERVKFPNFPWDSDYLETTLNPGDAVFIPKGWWHHVRSLSSSISISFWF
ncbi:hypothetical protein TRICI_005959 [Trichomonascus ciferrii]|uniref:JmjC domain-containing protein n=1 Tax=Trichomonascus ciferrii TaxID=44093 RepID=A0A642UN01_9ASCO|nr:hypothetical protein TRICI_005959 [Trichomonascus ciferrii]